MNPWKRLRKLIAGPPTLVGIIQAHNADGTSTAQLTGGGNIRVNGQDYAIGAYVLIKDHDIVGEAPSLPSYTVDV